MGPGKLQPPTVILGPDQFQEGLGRPPVVLAGLPHLLQGFGDVEVPRARRLRSEHRIALTLGAEGLIANADDFTG